MKKIDEMIKQLCPNGVEMVKLNTLLDYEQPSPYIVKSTEYSNEYETPVLTAGASFCLGYTNETDGIYKADEENPVIIFDDFTTSFHWVEFDFKVKSSAIKMLRPKKNNVSFRYIYFCMSCIDYVPAEHSRQWIGRYSNFEIPLPPLSIQKEIVSVLDKFSELIEKTDEEIALRQKQYEYYREKLYTPKENTKIVTISDLGAITRGKRFVRDDVKENGQPCIHYGDMYTYYGAKAYTTKTFLDRDFPKKMRYAKKGDIVIVGAGENDWDIGVGLAWFGDEPAAVHDACYILEHKENPMYISYFLRTGQYHQQLRKYVSDGKICSFSGTDLGKIKISLPSLSRQQEIVATLDKFEALISKLKEERELRQKQYEYYREKLLTFKNRLYHGRTV